MSWAIRVENLSKRYRLSHSEQRAPYRTLREDLARAVVAPVRWLRGHRSTREDFWALKDVSFDVQQGEVLGIIGRNGAGKSTLLKILSRITKPTSGQARIRGRVGSLLEVGTGFHPELTGRENIFLSGAVLGMTRREIAHKFDEIVDFADIQQFLDTPVKKYSSGMYVRLAFAVAAHLEPEVLLVDEVLAVGDAAFQRKCLGKIQNVVGHGRTVLFISHNMTAITTLCSHVVVLDNGAVQVLGDPDTAIRRYLGSNAHESDEGTPIRIARERFTTPSPHRLTDLEILGASGLPLHAIATGDPVCFRLHFRLDEPLRNPGFRLRVLSGERLELFRVSTEPISGYAVPALEAGVGYIDCVLPRFPFTAGRYLIDVTLARPKQAILHDVENAALLDVQAGNPYGTSASLTNKIGFFTCEHRWRLGTAPDSENVRQEAAP